VLAGKAAEFRAAKAAELRDVVANMTHRQHLVSWEAHAVKGETAFLEEVAHAAGKNPQDFTESQQVLALWNAQAAKVLNIDSTTEAWQQTAAKVTAVRNAWSTARGKMADKKFGTFPPLR
jgi:hypothetical protein